MKVGDKVSMIINNKKVIGKLLKIDEHFNQYWIEHTNNNVGMFYKQELTLEMGEIKDE